MDTAPLPSSLFKNSYSIFISKQAAPHFAKWINLSTWHQQNAVKVLVSTDDTDELAVIVIPTDKDFIYIEKELFDFKNQHAQTAVKESGFWGCHIMGYQGKTWSML
jgi:hypothetical protein